MKEQTRQHRGRRRARISLVFLYGVFSAIAIGVNLGVQRLVVLVYEAVMAAGIFPLTWPAEVEIYTALLAGTGAGLIVKYVLDKRFIFAFVTRSARHNIRTFVLYSIMGISTTAIFWGFELFFEFVLAFRGARYVGGLLGLVIGYTTKYALDRRFVFRVDPG